MHDIVVPATSSEDHEVEENPGYFSSYVRHSRNGFVSLAGIWSNINGFPLDSGKRNQFQPGNVCSFSQNKTWIKMTTGKAQRDNYSEYSDKARRVS
jgi:hypothetical protein